MTPVRDPRTGTVTHFVGVQHDITEIKQYQEELEHQANHDALTGLPNRNLLSDRLQQAYALAHRSSRKFVVAFIDLDNFKLINDSLGHGVGDDVLKIVAERLAGCVREGDTVARLGGDEFVLLAVEQEKGFDIYRMVNRVMTAIAQPFAIGAREFKVTCSVGVASFPDDGSDAETLLRNADSAMYQAKGLGRNTFRLYSPEMNANIGERLALEADLWHAVERDELLLHYQPKVELPTGRIIGMEALIRWNHPKRGMVSPAAFIPVAEESGLILEIGRWVIATACAQSVAWRDAGIAPIPMAVNISTRQLHDPDIVNVVRTVLAMSGLDPEHLELEVTESAAMVNAKDAIAAMTELRAMGVRISIDDFGTGYSSLSYLKRLPVTGLKIDQSFIRDLTQDSEDAAIVRAVIAVAKALALDVTAEGVETVEQVAVLNAYDCTQAQGYYFARPLPADAARALLARGVLPIA
jgi:diguanylate cyclase (GGDEF)-like protein